MRHETSIARQLRRYQSCTPSFCPNPECKFYLLRDQPFFHRFGSFALKRFPYRSYRFRCKECDKTFTSSIFTIHYRQRVWGLNDEILRLHLIGTSKREIARQINHSEHLVRLRITKFFRWSLLKQQYYLNQIKILEPIVYDGLENFSFSQYDPNNLNHAVGKESLFTYDFNLSPINRKGRMSERQARQKRKLEKLHGPYPKDAIRIATRDILGRLIKKTDSKLCLFSDRHFQYKRAIEDLKQPIEHFTVSSKIARNFKNHLFAINNIDMQARHNLAAFKRETIAFAKNTIGMVEGYTLYMVYRNYMRPKFWGTHRSDPGCNKRSPAMELGITSKILSFEEFFENRIFASQVTLNPDWRAFYERRDPFARRKIASLATI